MTFRKLYRLEIYYASDLNIACYHPKFFTLGKAIVEEPLRVGWMRWLHVWLDLTHGICMTPNSLALDVSLNKHGLRSKY
ncbi:hypothetical protein Q9233_002068 [Columba guinea]|nr:hypothetical protein Q9233_002068 [Columba guinea]